MPAKILMDGRLLPESKSPTPADASAPIPICRKPIKAEALPAFLPKGASASDVACGDKMPMHERKAKKRIIVASSPNDPVIVATRKTTPTTHWLKSAT